VGPCRLDLGALRQLEGIFDVDTEVADGTFDVRMIEENLHSAQVPVALDRYLRVPKRARAVFLRLEPDANNPFVNEASILARAHMPGVIVPAWENIVTERAAASLQPCPHRSPSGLEQFKLNGALRLLLHDDGSVANTPTEDEIADAHFDHIASAQLATDGKVE